MKEGDRISTQGCVVLVLAGIIALTIAAAGIIQLAKWTIKLIAL